MSNRLLSEQSPYLQQHASNPVDWYPWCDEAFQMARSNNIPVFVSIGYSACHWCHVMEREVFEDRQIAAFLNENMVCIKVDREERPDIDMHFQQVYQALHGRGGGWPLTIFLSPSLKPVYAATYLPPYSIGGMSGFMDVVSRIVTVWKENPGKLEDAGGRLLEFIGGIRHHVSGMDGPPEDIEKRFLNEVQGIYDPEWGGFSPAPKFPSTSIIDTLMVVGLLEQRKIALDMAMESLRRMASGGMHDLVDGGFCRYSVDSTWLVPHFEKMTCDNALLSATYFKAWRISGEKFMLDTALSTVEFMLEKMCEADLFYSSSDADSEGKEGEYFVFSRDEAVDAFVKAGFTHGQAYRMADHLSITTHGNFQGASIVRIKEGEAPDGLERAMAALKELRAMRCYPFIDRKIITAWNAMMISSLFLLSSTLPEYGTRAVRSLERLLDKMWRKGRLYHSSLPETDPVIPAFLDDHAFLVQALIWAFQHTMDRHMLEMAELLAQEALDRFFHNGRWFYSRQEFEIPAHDQDSACPSSSAVMVSAFMSLHSLTGNTRWMEAARKGLFQATSFMKGFPAAHGTAVCNAMRLKHGDIVIHGKPELLQKDWNRLTEPVVYPFILLSPEPGVSGYIICHGSSCTASVASVDEVLHEIRRIAAQLSALR